MTLATWNINSIRARLERVTSFLDRKGPDILCMQELKVEEGAFPGDAFASRGYKTAILGQKTYNGVAIVAKGALADVSRGLGVQELDTQARLIAATVEGIRVICVYAPNGGQIGTEAYDFKMKWLSAFREYLLAALKSHARVAVCGDLNIVPQDIDCHDPREWEGSVLYNEDLRLHFRSLLEVGFVDLFRSLNPELQAFTWWDYRQLAFPKNRGLRIDFVLASHRLAASATKCYIDRDERKGKKPSDHAPVWAVFEDPAGSP